MSIRESRPTSADTPDELLSYHSTEGYRYMVENGYIREGVLFHNPPARHKGGSEGRYHLDRHIVDPDIHYVYTLPPFSTTSEHWHLFKIEAEPYVVIAGVLHLVDGGKVTRLDAKQPYYTIKPGIEHTHLGVTGFRPALVHVAIKNGAWVPEEELHIYREAEENRGIAQRIHSMERRMNGNGRVDRQDPSSFGIIEPEHQA